METKLQTHRDPFVDWARSFNKRATNRLAMRFAGRKVYGVIHHVGRRSGKAYETPVLPMPANGGFYIPLPYGEQADWCQNLLAAGGGTLDWQGRRYTVCAPALVTPAEALRVFPRWLHPLLRRTHIYLKVARTPEPPLPLNGPAIRSILVYGAGVLGSVYAGKLVQAGYDVTLLARGQRLAELRDHGLMLIEAQSGAILHTKTRVTEHLAPEDAYDLVLVIVRKNQLASVLPALAANRHTPNVLFMVNNAAGAGEMVRALGAERVLLGFPGGGGQRQEGIVRYQLAGKRQPTTLGELDDRITPRLESIAGVFHAAGLLVALSDNMDAWLKTHVALVSPIANALYLAGGDNYRLARTQDGLILLVRAVREGLRVLRALDIPITPASIQALEWLPEPLLVAMLRRRLPNEQARLVLSNHANAARDEMSTLAEEFRGLARQAGIPTPAMDELYCYVDPHTAPLPDGQADLRLDWRQAVLQVSLLSALLVGVYYLFRRGARK